MKKLLFLLLPILLLLCACGSHGRSEIISEINNNHELSMVYESFTGVRETAITVSDSTTTTVSASITSQEGSLSIRIEDEDGNVIYSGDNITSSTSLNLLLHGPNTYTITAESKAHTGSYSFTWESFGVAATVQPNVTPGSDGSEENHADQTIPDDLPELMDWNGTFQSADGSSTIDLLLADNNSFEFDIHTAEGTFVAVARISADAPDCATYTDDTLSIQFQLSADTLTVTQEGTSDALSFSVAGVYTLQP